MNILLDVAYFKFKSVVDINTSDDLIKVAIKDAQSFHLESLIGFNLLNKISEDGYNGVLEDPYKYFLFNFLHPYLIKATEYELLMKLMFRQTAQGIIKNTSNSTENATTTDMRELKFDVEQKMNELGNRIIKYLNYHFAEFPEYTNLSVDKENPVNNQIGMIYIDPQIHQQSINRNTPKY